jgi:hypothetical protein
MKNINKFPKPILRNLRVRVAELCYGISCVLQYCGDWLLGHNGRQWLVQGGRHLDYAMRGYDRWKDLWA